MSSASKQEIILRRLRQLQEERENGDKPTTICVNGTSLQQGTKVTVRDDAKVLDAAESAAGVVRDGRKKVYLGESGRIVVVYRDYKGHSGVDLQFADGEVLFFLSTCLVECAASSSSVGSTLKSSHRFIDPFVAATSSTTAALAPPPASWGSLKNPKLLISKIISDSISTQQDNSKEMNVSASSSSQHKQPQLQSHEAAPPVLDEVVVAPEKTTVHHHSPKSDEFYFTNSSDIDFPANLPSFAMTPRWSNVLLTTNDSPTAVTRVLAATTSPRNRVQRTMPPKQPLPPAPQGYCALFPVDASSNRIPRCHAASDVLNLEANHAKRNVLFRKTIVVKAYINGEYGDVVHDVAPFHSSALRPTLHSLPAVYNALTRDVGWHPTRKVTALYHCDGSVLEEDGLQRLTDGASVVVSSGDRFIVPSPKSVLFLEVEKLSRTLSASLPPPPPR